MVDGERMQEVDEPYEFSMAISRWPGLHCSESEIEGGVHGFVRKFSDQKYDLGADRLFRATILVLSDERHLLVVGAHHLFFDGWSVEMLVQEFMAIYQKLLQGQVFTVEEEELRYSDYGVWQMAVRCERGDREKRYWETRLAGGIGIQWPGKNYCPDNECLVLEMRRPFDDALNAELHAFARRARTSWSLELLAAYATVVSECCGQSDFVITTLLNDRDRIEHRSVAGFLAHPIFLRVELKENDTFADLLNRLGKEYLGALLHRDFGETVMDYFFLCSGTVFQWFPATGSQSESDAQRLNCRGEFLAFRGNAIFPKKFDVAIYLIETGQSLSAWVRHRPEVISADSMELFLQKLESTLWRLVRQPNARIAL
jgi:hypothetical protein